MLTERAAISQIVHVLEDFNFGDIVWPDRLNTTAKFKLYLDLSKNEIFFNFSYSFFSEQLNLEDQNRFILLAKDGETRTPSTGTKNNKFVSGMKFSSINVNGIMSKKT